jgi:hypothetical protein
LRPLRDHHLDLHEHVMAKEVSAHEPMVAAGFRTLGFVPGRTIILRAIASLAALGISAAAMAQPCHPGPRLFETDRVAYAAQARRVFAAHGISYTEHRNYELDHRVPRCLAVGDYDGDNNLWPQPRAEALVKDDMEAEVCRLVCQFRTIPLEYAVELFADWRAGYRIVFGQAPGDP